MNYQLLDWDSDFFGFKVGKIIPARLGPENLREALKELKEKGVSLVYWSSDSGDAVSQEAAVRSAGFLADKKTTYAIDLSKAEGIPQTQSGGIDDYPSQEPEKELEELALISGQYSRFKLDPKVPAGKFEELYRLWITRSTQGILAEKVLVFREGSRVAGMVTLARQGSVGEIGLLAVRAEFSGRGVGTALVRAAQLWFAREGCGRGRVVTQGSNEPAKRLYEKCGYAVEKIENFYHFWIGKVDRP